MLIFSGVLAWITLFLFVLLVIKYIIRLLAKRFTWLQPTNRIFSKIHKPAGLLILITGLLHGLTSSAMVFSLNLGTITLISFILLAISYFLKRFYKPRFLLIHRALTIISIILVITHIVDVGGLNLIHKITHGNTDYIENNTALHDGFYEGEGTGLKGKIVVSVEIQNGKIHDILILDSQDTKEYLEKAEHELKEKIIAANSASFDSVAGATYASNGYLEAVRSALEKSRQK